MTPPLIRPWGRPLGESFDASEETLESFRPTPEYRSLSRALLASRESASDQGRDMLARSLPECRGNPDCSPDLALLPVAVSQSEAAAARNPALYRMTVNFLAAQYMNTEDETARAELRDQARRIARVALDRVSDPRFSPPPEDRNRIEEPVRTRTRMLFSIASTLSAILARPEAETFTAEDRALLREYFVRIRSGLEQVRERKRLNPDTLGFPEYFDHYVQAQIALIDGQREAAFSSLLRTRALLNNLSAEASALPFPNQVRAGTELALQSIPRDESGRHVEDLRSLIGIEALSYAYQADFNRSHGEAEAATAERRAHALSLLASVSLQGGPGRNARELLQSLRSAEGSAELRSRLAGNLRSDSNLREALGSMYSGNLSEAGAANRAAGEILADAAAAANAILSHAEEEPYRSILQRDGEDRASVRAAELLNADPDLLAHLRGAFNLPEEAAAEQIVGELMSYGSLLPALLETLPEELRQSESGTPFFRELSFAAEGYRGAGMQRNFERPLLNLIEDMHRLSLTDEEHAPTYFTFFRSLEGLERIAPDAELSPALRRIARGHADGMESFSLRRVGRHLASWPSIGMMIGGLALSELAPIWLLRGARIPLLRSAETAAAVRNTGEMGVLVNAGRLTPWGEAVAGLGVGLAMHIGGVGAHVVSVRGTQVGEYGQELQNIGLANLAAGTVFSMAALGLTMGSGHLMRRGLLPEGASLAPGRLALGHVGLRLGNWTVGGLSMLAAHGATSALAGHSFLPNSEQAAEVFLTMALWDAGAAGLRFGLSRTSFWRHQAGPFRANQIFEHRLAQILQRNPRLERHRPVVEASLRSLMRSPSEFGRVGRALEEGHRPVLVGEGANRRLVFRAPEARVAAAPEAPAPTRTTAARTVAQLTRGDVEIVRQILRSSAFRDVENPEGMPALREALRERLEAGETNPILWVRATLSGRSLLFEILPGEPAAGERNHTFTLESSGKIQRLDTDNAVLRNVLAGYNESAELSIPILADSPGAESAPPAVPEAETAAHRTPRLAPAEPEPSRPETPRTERPAEPEEPRAEVESEAPEEMSDTRPRRPSQSLLAASRAPDEHGAVTAPPPRAPRGDNTVPFSTRQAQRAASDSRPDAPLPTEEESMPPPRPSDQAETLALTDTAARELRERLGEELVGERAPRAAARSGSEDARELRPDEVELLPDDSPETAPEEFNFSDAVEGSVIPEAIRQDSTPTVVPPPPRAEVPGRVVTRQGPPPLPPRRPEGATEGSALSSFSSAADRGSRTADPILLIVRRAHRIDPVGSSETTSAIRSDSVNGYQRFVTSLDAFIEGLFAAHRDIVQQDRANPQEALTERYFVVEVTPQHEMRLIDSASNLRYTEDGYSYFTLRRRMTDPEDVNSVNFLLDTANDGPYLSPEHERLGWRNYLRSTFE